MIPSDATSASCLIVGAGPGGLAPLVAAAHVGKLQELLDAGVVIVERGDKVGSGELGRYAISSDSATEAFLDAVMRTEEPKLAALRSHPTVTAMSQYIGHSIPLELAATYLNLLGETLCGLVEASAEGLVLRKHTALSSHLSANGIWSTRVRCETTGWVRTIRTSAVVLATGAEQPESRLRSEKIAGVSLLPTYADKVFQSGTLLTKGGLEKLLERLSSEKNPRVVVVGGSTSAGAVTRVLLNECPSVALGADAVTLMHRKPLRIFYNSAEEALAEGYTDFGPKDICQLSGRVYRLAGFRLETRELMMRAMGIAGRPPEPRLKLHHLGEESDAQTRRLLDESHVIVAALGYRPRGLNVAMEDGTPIPLKSCCDAMRPMVGNDCHVLTEEDMPIPGLYGIGLASGFVPSGVLGGEESFHGQANSLWLWQHDVGARIVDGVLRDHSDHVDLNAVTTQRMPVELRMEKAYEAKL